MLNLKTKYMGLDLKNPVIAGASNLVTDPDNLKKIEDAGAAAIVYKSLFEEQIQLENLELYERLTEYDERNAEMITTHPQPVQETSYSKEHLYNLGKAKKSVSIPVIASLNAVRNETWVEYAVKFQDTGVDALELNFYSVPEKSEKSYSEVEKRQIETLQKIKEAVVIPVSVKLSPYYSNPFQLINDLEIAGSGAFVLFNRLFQSDIDVNREEHIFPYSLSNVEDSRLSLRFAGLLYGNTKSSICANSGIFSGLDVVKMILAGADCVQVVSTLYLNQIGVIKTIIQDIGKWMDTKGYETLDTFRGKMSKSSSGDKVPYFRTQYLDFQLNTSSILKKYKIIN